MVEPASLPAELQALQAERDRLRAELERVRARVALFEQVLAGTAAGVAVCDRELRYQLFNPAMERMTASRAAEVMGRRVEEVFPLLRATQVLPALEAALRGEASELPAELYHDPESGHQRWTFSTHVPLREPDGEVSGVLSTVVDVSAQQRAELELARRKTELDRFFSLSLDLLCIADTQGRFLELSPAWARTLGYPIEELTGSSFIELVHPEDRDSTAAAAATLAAGIPVIDFANRFQHRDGSWRWLQWRSAADTERVYAVARDITGQREAHARLLQSEADLRRSQSVSRVGSYRVDLRTGQARTSAVMDEILGFAPGDSNAFEIYKGVIHPEDRPGFLEYFEGEVLRNGRPINREYRIVRANDGEIRWVHDLNELELAPDGSVIAMFGTIQDITERKQAEIEHQKLAAKLQQAQKLESLNVLAGGIAHDFNNLLTSMLGNADLALTELPVSSPARSNLADIETAARRAAELCRQLLAYSGKGKFQLQVVDLREVVEEMGQLLSVSVGKQAMLRYDFSPDVPGIEADPTQIRQVVMNLITNASEAIGEGSGIIRVSTGTMSCDEEYLREAWSGSELTPGRYAVLEVSDTGVGMTPATQKRVFDPFFSTKFAGRGLGLAAVLGIVRGHRGAIKVYSEPGKGSTFKLLFPAVESPPEPLQARPVGSAWRGRGKVLLVDDESVVLSVGRAILSKAGLTVITAEDGEQAIEAFRNERDIRCVILDLTMPNMDGETCFRELRRLDPGVKVVLTSGYNEQDVVNRFTGKGLAGFVQKPYRAAELLSAVRQVLEADQCQLPGTR